MSRRRPASRSCSANFPEVIRLLDRYYNLDYSLTSLFRDEQRRILQIILNSTLSDIEELAQHIYDDHASLLHYLSQAGLPKPPALALAAGFAVNAGLRRALEADPIDITLIRSFLAMAKADEVTPRHSDPHLHRRPAHEARHARTADVLRLARNPRPCPRPRTHSRRVAFRTQPLAGAEHLVRDPAQLQLFTHCPRTTKTAPSGPATSTSSAAVSPSPAMSSSQKPQSRQSRADQNICG